MRAARGEDGLPRPPAWMMRQAGRYMAEYQALAKRHPSFRERSETTELIVEITLQPWRAFAPDGVILFSDILTPLPAIGVPFDISDSKGPVIQSPVRSEEQVRELTPINFEKLRFVGESLKILRTEVMRSHFCGMENPLSVKICCMKLGLGAHDELVQCKSSYMSWQLL